MEIIIHRVNTVDKLKEVDISHGAEIDIRASGRNLILNHEPYSTGESLVDFLNEYSHGTLVLNIKEAGIEDDVLDLVRQRKNIEKYFLLDVEFPYLYRASKAGEKNLAVRFSEEEPIEAANIFAGKVDWVWIDTNTELPVTPREKPVLDKYKKCLVCPERWGRPGDIAKYWSQMSAIGFELDAVMTSARESKKWEELNI